MYHSYLANFVGPAARFLREKHGITTTLACYSRSGLPVSGRHDFEHDDFERIFEFDPHLDIDPTAELGTLGDIARRSNEFEQRTGLCLLEAIRADRLVGIQFVSGAWFPRSRYGRRLDYPKISSVAVNVAEAIERLLDEVQPSAVVGVSSALAPSILWRLAAKRGIPTRNLVIARSGKGVFWCEDDFMMPMGLDRAFHQHMLRMEEHAPFEERASAQWMPAPFRAQEAIRAVARPPGIAELLVRLGRTVRSSLVRRLRGRGRVYGSYLLWDQLRLVANRWRWRRALGRERAEFASLPEDVPFVFCPLQVEPEATLMFESPMCDNSLTAIDWLAKTAPAGWLVVVKEHPGATAPRPKGFWRQIRRYPNVVVAGTLEDGEVIAQRSRAVCVLNSSLGLQAAGIGKPVISFHPGFVGAILGHVQLIDSYESMKSALVRVRDNDLPPMSRRLLEAKALLKSLDDLQFPCDDSQILSGTANEKHIASDEVKKIVVHLLKSLPPAASTALSN